MTHLAAWSTIVLGGQSLVLPFLRDCATWAWCQLRSLPFLVWAGPCWLWRWLTGSDLPGRGDTEQSGIPPLATLLAVAITQAVALLYVHYESGARPFALLVYGLLAVIVLGGMLGVVRATRPTNGGGYRAAFNEATMKWGSWAIIWTIAGLGTVACLYAAGRLPRKPVAQVTKAIDYDWKFDRSEGKKIVFTATPPAGGAFPRLLLVEVQLKEDLAKHWEIEHVVGYEDADLKVEIGNEGPSKIQGTTAARYVGLSHDLKNQTYYFVVSLHALGGMTREELNRTTNLGKDAIKVTVSEYEGQ